MSVLDQRDEDTFTLTIISAAQWKENAPEVFSAFENFSSFCSREEVVNRYERFG
jgi:hypothetical protein